MTDTSITNSRPLSDRVPPHIFFMVSAVFHYLGPSFAVLLFAQVGPLGVAWMRIASAALIFGLWKKPWRLMAAANQQTRLLVVALGVTLAAMNSAFYLAIARMPLATVAAIEFTAVITLALIGVRSLRNGLALAIAVAGVFLLIGFQWSANWLGLAFAIANAVLFAAYVVIGHRVSRQAAVSRIDLLAAAMAVALVAAFPFGLADLAPMVSSPVLILAGVGVGITSSVIPYVCDQLAMARLPRATFALMLTLLPATATVTGAIILGQIPSWIDIAGISLVALGVGLHRPSPEARSRSPAHQLEGAGELGERGEA